MAPRLRCTVIMLATWPILPLASKFAHSDNLISFHFEDNYTFFRILFDSVSPLTDHWGGLRHLCSICWVLIALNSAHLGLFGSIGNDLFGCSELLSCSVVTSKPLYILLIYLYGPCQVVAVQTHVLKWLYIISRLIVYWLHFNSSHHYWHELDYQCHPAG